jgi:hypothetical protein
MSSKTIKSAIKKITLDAPAPMEYYVNINTDKDRSKYITRIEKIIRASQEYKDYINFLKDHVDLNKCVFFQNVTSDKSVNKRGKVSIELHHEPFTLYDYVDVVLRKFQDTGRPLNDLLIADEVLELHYSNMVGLVPLSKTMHEVIHNSTKLFVPLNMVYGEYSKFLDGYEEYISDELYDKLQRKLDLSKNLTPESFEAIKKEFTYVDVNCYDDINKLETASNIAI